MKTLKYSLSNWLWMQLCRRKHRQFREALREAQLVQRNYLINQLKSNSGTEYGKEHGFDSIDSVSDYQKRVPLTDYEDYSSYIERIATGARGVLTDKPVLLFEPSSGSASASKLIPYTSSLKQEFQMGICPWIYSLFRDRPELMRGQSYWSVSPPMAAHRLHGVIPVGFEKDTEYLGMFGQHLVDKIMAVPGSIVRETTPDAFWIETLAHLVLAENLTMISVWSPSFLIVLLETIKKDLDRVLERMHQLGSSTASARAKHVSRCLSSEEKDVACQKIWPKLTLISCWADGPSERLKDDLYAYFPNVAIQGKGLIATEAFVSLPYQAGRDPVLAVNSHFFEFRDCDRGEILLAHQLTSGRDYSVIVTTGGGLYRYQLRDRIRVTGFIDSTPTFRFLGKENAVSDIYGEKLHPEHVERSVRDTLAECDCQESFFLLAPVQMNGTTSYTLFVAIDQAIEPMERLADSLESKLCNNYHYAHCRKIRQLGKPRVFLIEPSGVQPEGIYLEELSKRGIKFGDIKPSVIDSRDGWETRFPGRFIDEDADDHKY